MATEYDDSSKLNINRSILGNRIYSIDNDFIFDNLGTYSIGSNNPENQFVALQTALDISVHFPAILSTLGIIVLLLDIPHKMLIFFITTLLLYTLGVYKTFTKLNPLDIAFYPLYYLFAKFHILIFIALIIALIILKFYIAIPIFIAVKLLGFIIMLRMNRITLLSSRKKYGLDLYSADYFILSNLDRYSSMPNIGRKGYIRKYSQYLSDENNFDNTDEG